MQKMLSILFTPLVLAALAYSPQQVPVDETNPGCIVMPEVIEACEKSGGRFDFKLCSCVGGAEVF